MSNYTIRIEGTATDVEALEADVRAFVDLLRTAHGAVDHAAVSHLRQTFVAPADASTALDARTVLAAFGDRVATVKAQADATAAVAVVAAPAEVTP
jgi:hypothetical protein